jgi:signal transduction histidine kinase
MASWLNSPEILLTLAIIALVGVTASVVFGLLWWKIRSQDQLDHSAAGESEHQRIDAELRIKELADRFRLVSEVHDAAAASLTRMISRAEGASFAATADPEAASRAASAIADEARVVLGDLRRVVNVSRSESQDNSEPTPSLSVVQDLFRAMDKSGVVVKFEETGEAFPVGSSAELAIYRILQEALNNSRSHGGPGTTVKVSMTWSSQGMHLRIDDDGIRAHNRIREEAGESTGYGVAEHQRALVEILDGRGMKDMKARTEAFGGVFSAHRVPGVGFNISAAFPTLRYHNGVHGVDVSGRSGGKPS